MKRPRHQQAAKELDINEEPTEPSLPAVVLPPSSPPLDWYTQSAYHGTFPGRQSPQSYPVLPARIPSRKTQHKHNVLPAFVGVFFVAIQLLLLVRFALRLIEPTARSATSWIGIIYILSGVWILPFRLLFQHLAFPITGNLEIYTLVAILFYGLLSRVLARFTRAILRSW
jgi:hypothetical protein